MLQERNNSWGNYTVSAYAGNHTTCEGTVHFLISNGNSTLLYGFDGAWLLYDKARAIIAAKPEPAVWDGTVGFIDGDYRIFEHNNLNMVLEMQKMLAPLRRAFLYQPHGADASRGSRNPQRSHVCPRDHRSLRWVGTICLT